MIYGCSSLLVVPSAIWSMFCHYFVRFHPDKLHIICVTRLDFYWLNLLCFWTVLWRAIITTTWSEKESPRVRVGVRGQWPVTRVSHVRGKLAGDTSDRVRMGVSVLEEKFLPGCARNDCLSLGLRLGVRDFQKLVNGDIRHEPHQCLYGTASEEHR